MRIIYSPKFLRQYKKLLPHVQNIAENKMNIFMSDMFDSRLKSHKLSGPLEAICAFSITHSIRIIFKKYDEYIVFLQIGDHDIYD